MVFEFEVEVEVEVEMEVEGRIQAEYGNMNM